MSINKKILSYLESKGISQALLVKKTGISKQNLFRILNSDDIKVSQLIQIAKALDLPETYFFEGSDENRIKELEKANSELAKSLNTLMDSVKSSNEQTNKLLQTISILFTSKNSEEAEKARLALVSIVDFFRNKEA